MPISPDLLKDFIDGKLAADEEKGVAAAIADNPDLIAYVQDQKALNTALTSPAVVLLKHLHERIATKSANWIPVCAMACGMGLGVMLASSFGLGTDLHSQNGTLIAQGELAHVLSSSLSGEEANVGSAARVASSFWSKNGSFCRSFVTRGNAESALSGIACRERGAWRIAATATMAPADATRAQLVTGDLPASIRNVMDNLIVGQPLDADAERQLRNQGWRAR
jgi:hypothetical protein